MIEVNSYRDLRVWQSAMAVAESVYGITTDFPASELFGLSSQMRRAAVSVASNIAEGHGRETSGAFVNALRIAQGSLKELETQLLLAQRLALGPAGAFDPVLQQCDEVGRMLRALLRAIQDKQAGNPR